jgi:hypothetical protein
VLAHPAIRASLAGAAPVCGHVVAISLAAQDQPRTIRQVIVSSSSAFSPKMSVQGLHPGNNLEEDGRVNHEGSIGVRRSPSPIYYIVIIVKKDHPRVAQVILTTSCNA